MAMSFPDIRPHGHAGPFRHVCGLIGDLGAHLSVASGVDVICDAGRDILATLPPSCRTHGAPIV